MIALWILLALLALSSAEYVAHRFFMHQKGWNQFSYESHTMLHHHRFYTTSRFAKCRDLAAKYVGIELHAGYMLLGSAVLWGPLLFVSLTGAVVFALAFTLHGFIWTNLHREMHEPAGRWFSTWRLYAFWRSYHKRHHEVPTGNFNVLVPFWDFVFGTYRGLAE